MNNNGPAFPYTKYNPRDGNLTVPGMSLRAYFAGKAMQGICSSYQHRIFNGDNDAERWAEEAVNIADALLAELEGTQ